ncbi:MAG: hypothetical protein ACSHYF_17870 [Verrucomicrobiaceae bacterium]
MRFFVGWIVVLWGFQFVAGAQEEESGLPVVEIIFFSPKDIEPPKDVVERLGKLAVETENFFEKEMKGWNYPVERKKVFARNEEGKVKVAFVRGSETADTGKYDFNYQALPGEIVGKAHKSSSFSRNGDCYWIFVYLGTKREFNGWVGIGSAGRGGYGIVRYDAKGGMKQAKTRIHELGHALTLPHIGPKVSDEGDCNLMGPNEPTYQRRLKKKWDSYYLSESAAARLWKHPLFSGTLEKRGQRPKVVKLAERKVRYDGEAKSIKIEGTIDCDLEVHSVIVHDDSSGPNQEYWRKTYVGRVDEAGAFTIEVDELSDYNGMLQFYFCVDGGVTTQCETKVIYGFEKGQHVVQGFIPRSLPLEGPGVAKIVSAEWGTLLRHARGTTTDVSAIIAKQMKGGAVSMLIDYKVLGDPDPGRKKALKVKYLLEGEEKEGVFQGRAGSYLILPPLEEAN